MTEATLTAQLITECEKVMPFAQMLKHSDRANAGYPDFTCTWHGVTTWWEVKFYDNRMFKTPIHQTIKCCQLAEQGHCQYIIYQLRDTSKTGKSVSIVHPKNLKLWRNSTRIPGWDHHTVAWFIRNFHWHTTPEPMLD